MALAVGRAVNPAWWTRLCDVVSALLSRSGRRVVVDLPAYAGWGPTGIAPTPPRRTDPGDAIHGPLNLRTMTYADGTTHLSYLCGRIKGAGPPVPRKRPSYDVAFTSARNKAERAADAGAGVAYVTADEYMAVHFSVSMRLDLNPPKGPTDLVLQTPHGAVKMAIESTDRKSVV